MTDTESAAAEAHHLGHHHHHHFTKDHHHSVHQHHAISPFKRATFYINRASSHTSLNSANHFNHHQQQQCYYANEVDLSRPGTPTDQQSTVLNHLYKHASTFGLNAASIETNNKNHHGDSMHSKNILPQEMSTDDTGVQHSAAFLSWRKLHLSRAKLKAASNTSALLAGFAMVAVVELQLEPGENKKLPVPLLILFAICTTLLVAVHMLALLISTCILPNMDAISNLHSLSLVHESPHEKMHRYIELAWGCSTVLGILLFMIEIIILCWIQFYHVLISAAYVATAILVPFVVLFVWFAFIFYRKLVAHTYETRKSGIQELERLKNGLEMGDVDLISQKHAADHHIV